MLSMGGLKKTKSNTTGGSRESRREEEGEAEKEEGPVRTQGEGGNGAQQQPGPSASIALSPLEWEDSVVILESALASDLLPPSSEAAKRLSHKHTRAVEALTRSVLTTTLNELSNVVEKSVPSSQARRRASDTLNAQQQMPRNDPEMKGKEGTVAPLLSHNSCLLCMDLVHVMRWLQAALHLLPGPTSVSSDEEMERDNGYLDLMTRATVLERKEVCAAILRFNR